MKLIDNWHLSWKWFSMQISGLGVAAVGAYALLPAKFQEAIPQSWWPWLAGGTFVLIMAGRVIEQGSKKPPEETEDQK